ncbi:FkbM family methyltransferase [Cellulomonas sp.]|uniref:FkbM family methyltransferase n=1 Tax=Cellulomonas sp. TaxID=40001 RepID=UPI00281158BD|nr:FkbM family methyltransferase [Cellulomonas sp.]
MPQPTFVSHAQNGEDVVLHRALRTVGQGRYVEVGANHPESLSITRGFYDLGWSGVTIDPVAAYADLHGEQRPRDTFVRAAVTDAEIDEVEFHEFPGTGLSTLDAEVADRHRATGRESVTTRVPARRLDDVLESAGLRGQDIHFLVVDTEGAEAQVLASIDLTRWRPWVMVVESTAPLDTAQTHGSWEPRLLEQGYEFCLFDGLSRFYVAREHADRLRESLSYPACPLDEYVLATDLRTQERIDALVASRDQLTSELVRWRGEAVARWSAATVAASAAPADDGAAQQEAQRLREEVAQLHRELAAVRATVSWRVTAPLRAVRGVTRGAAR